MTNAFRLAEAGAMGLLLGAVFFCGLWWTVRMIVLSKHPALWFFGSLFLRMGIILTGFYLVGRAHWDRLLACLLGFVCARFIVTLITPPPVENPHPPVKEARHAP